MVLKLEYFKTEKVIVTSEIQKSLYLHRRVGKHQEIIQIYMSCAEQNDVIVIHEQILMNSAWYCLEFTFS